MTIHQLALLVNDSQKRRDCLVRETWDKVVLSGLSPDLTRAAADLAVTARLACSVMDGVSRDVALGDVDDVQGPYQIVLEKPVDTMTGYILSLLAMDDLLFDIGRRRNIRIAGLSQPFEALGIAFTPWEIAATALSNPTPLKSPRTFVREYGDNRVVPLSLAQWLMPNPSWHADEPVFVRWATLSVKQCMLSLGDEVKLAPLVVIFKGPPRSSMPIPDIAQTVDEPLFSAMQACSAWVYETPSETEMRHPLLAAEIARIAPAGATLIPENGVFETALESARLAYQLGMSKLSSDTLKMLTDLRKSVLDEATKVSDGTRQLVAAVATTLSLEIGLIAAKIGVHADGRLIGAITVIAVVYMVAIVWSGYCFLKLQGEIRDQWKPRTYGFISLEGYKSLVEEPATKAADVYRTIARIGCWLSFGMLIVVIWVITSFK